MFNEKESFLAAFSADKQIEITSNEFNIWFGAYPTLSVINTVFPGTAQQWLILQLNDLQDYLRIGDTERLTEFHNIQISVLIFREFYYLKVSEIMYFFMLIKSAIFGKIYNKIDPLNIMEWLRHFVVFYRKPAIDAGMQQIEDAYEQWHSQNVIKDRDLNHELPNLMRLISEKIGGNKAPDPEGSDLVYESALTLVNNTAYLSPEDLMAVCRVWTARHGCDPYEYVTKNKKEG